MLPPRIDMKLLVFAHLPPSGHSSMVQMMLDGLGGDRRRNPSAPVPSLGMECYHVNAPAAIAPEETSDFAGMPALPLLWPIAQAIWCRFRYGVKTIYYIPSAGGPVALFRDTLTMRLLRPFFPKIIFHWRVAGLARWLELVALTRTRHRAYQRMRDAHLAIILADFNRPDAEKFTPQKVVVVPNGLPDPLGERARELLVARSARMEARRDSLAGRPVKWPDAMKVRVLFLGLCTRQNGVFDAVQAVAEANQRLAATGQSFRFYLTIGGEKASAIEETELQNHLASLGVERFVERQEKLASAIWYLADLFCFPTYHPAENQPTTLIEAMAHGLPLVTTRWHAIPGMMPSDYPGLVDPQSPAQIAEALLTLATADWSGEFRERFLQYHTLEKHLAALAGAMRSVESA